MLFFSPLRLPLCILGHDGDTHTEFYWTLRSILVRTLLLISHAFFQTRLVYFSLTAVYGAVSYLHSTLVRIHKSNVDLLRYTGLGVRDDLRTGESRG